MSEQVELVQLEARDDVTTIRDRLAFLRGKSVLLVWPQSGTVLTRKLDLVLIQREAKRLAIRLALVTDDPAVVRHAAELNISVFDSIAGSRKSRWLRTPSTIFTGRSQKPKDEPAPEELMPVASRVRVASDETPLQRILRLIGRFAALLLLLALGGALAYLLIPSATVTITPARTTASAEANVIADPTRATIDAAAGMIPALTLRVEVEERGAVPTTGAAQTSSAAATGTVIFINKTANEITIPADVVVGTSAGAPILFRTLQSAVVPAGIGFQIEVPVEALPEFSGTAGNIGANLINTIVGELADVLEVRNVAPISGGANTSVRAVSAADRERLLATLRQQIQERAYTEMINRLDDSQIIIPETIRIAEEREDWLRFDREIGEIAETLGLTMRAVVVATAIDEGAAQQVAFTRLTAQIASGQTVRSVACQRTGGLQFLADGRIGLTIACSGLVEAQVNVNALREQLARLPMEEAQQVIAQSVVLAQGSSAQIALTPDWFPTLPVLPLRISIRVLEAPAA